jgi:hypothetical protein
VENLPPITLKDGSKVRGENESKLIASLQDFHWQASGGKHSSRVNIIRIGLSIVALQTVLESTTEHIAIIDKPILSRLNTSWSRYSTKIDFNIIDHLHNCRRCDQIMIGPFIY